MFLLAHLCFAEEYLVAEWACCFCAEAEPHPELLVVHGKVEQEQLERALLLHLQNTHTKNHTLLWCQAVASSAGLTLDAVLGKLGAS